MTGRTMRETRLIQIFLPANATGNLGVFEVTSDNAGDLFCTCPAFLNKGACKHSRLVHARIKSNNGTYPLEVSKNVTPEDFEMSKKSAESCRDFIIKFSKIEVV